MSFSNPTLSDTERTIHHAMRTHWALFVAQGVIMIVLGIIAIIWPAVSTLAVDIYVGWVFLLSGVTGLVTMFFALTVPAFLWSLLTAALSLFCGVLLLWHPVAGAVTLTLVLIAFFIAEGVFQIAAAISYRDAFPGSWGWMVMSGLADLVLAALIISGWPGSAAWALGLIVGVNLITSGLAITMVAIAGRKLVNAIDNGSR
ncbi:HdeD family acid-resistance protein [Bradyrhizobium sp. HKCCYLS1011]|uniref:HdeD family acid-resistance protein n=1 Tax=Bradyrhizobium sp. HKCCYLS1011 TaxID=3420733 RepID=UPI003EBF2491